jgi:hypothetical protein
VLQTPAAVLTATAVDQRHHGNPIAGTDTGYVAAGSDDLAGELVPEDLGQSCSRERMRLDRRDYRAGDVLMEVSATDSDPARGDHDLGCADSVGFGDVLDP